MALYFKLKCVQSIQHLIIVTIINKAALEKLARLIYSI